MASVGLDTPTDESVALSKRIGKTAVSNLYHPRGYSHPHKTPYWRQSTGLATFGAIREDGGMKIRMRMELELCGEEPLEGFVITE